MLAQSLGFPNRRGGLIVPNLGAIIPIMGTDEKPTGLGEVLFSKAQRRVLGLLFGNPDRSYFANEIIRAADSGTGAVHRVLVDLIETGLVTVMRVGPQRHFQANRDSPIFDELRGIVVKTFGLADVLRGELAPLAPRIRAAFIYGSIAKGSDTSSSDVDLMVIADDLPYPDLFTAVTSAEQRLGRKVSPTIYGSAELQRKLDEGQAFVSRVLQQPKIFIIGSEDDLGKPRKARKRKAAQG
jgi:predicted nucleotidyltransferase